VDQIAHKKGKTTTKTLSIVRQQFAIVQIHESNLYKPTQRKKDKGGKKLDHLLKRNVTKHYRITVGQKQNTNPDENTPIGSLLYVHFALI